MTKTKVLTENDVRNTIRDHLLYHGWLVLRINSGARQETNPTTGKRKFFWFAQWQALGCDAQHAGVSDILAIQPGSGRLWAIEVKKPGKLSEVTTAQAAFLEAVRARGGVGVVADSIEALEQEIKKEGRHGNALR